METNDVIKFLTGSSTLVLVGLIVGVVVKYVPFLAKIPNLVIPYLNALIVFFGAFPAAAHAGIFGDIGKSLGLGGKAVLSLAVASIASVAYETYLRHPLEKLGVVKAKVQ